MLLLLDIENNSARKYILIYEFNCEVAGIAMNSEAHNLIACGSWNLGVLALIA